MKRRVSNSLGLGASTSGQRSSPQGIFLAVSVRNQSPAGPLSAWGASGGGGLTLSPTQADPKVTLPACSLLSITQLSEWVTVSELCVGAQEKRALCGSQETL